MAQVDAFDGVGDVNELAGAQRPTAADIDQPRFTKDMTVRWLCYLVNGTLKSAGCKSADKVGVLKARLKSLLGVAEDDDADLGAEAEGATRRRWKNRARRESHEHAEGIRGEVHGNLEVDLEVLAPACSSCSFYGRALPG